MTLRRLTWLSSILFIVGLLSYAIYIEKTEYLDACSLCLTQRFFYAIVAIGALLGLFMIQNRRWQSLSSIVYIVGAIGGISTAGRQVWLQHLPADKVPECGLGLMYWLENEPVLQTIKLLFQGDGNCAEVDWTFFGFSMAEWSLLFFVTMLVVGVIMLVKRPGLSAAQNSIAH